MSVEFFFARPRRAVDTLQLLLIAITAPIRARHFHQFKGLANLACAGQVRAEAKVKPFALLINRDDFIFRQIRNKFSFEILAHVLEDFYGLIAVHDQTFKLIITVDNERHLLFDRGKIVH